ncbi:MAG: 1-acyl-sn-glycerol-3-phosphate acyltransferase [Firmicutes bacterium]|nr:1-acyl-sn-glycerol-3-phosphate acyltransferase [Bacillota bacterium]
MKIFGNIGLFYTVGTSFLGLGKYQKRIDEAKAKGNKEEERQAIYEVSKFWSNKIVNWLGLEINVVNPENLPEEGPVVYVANHQSYGDVIPFLHVTKHQVGFIAKDSLERFPVFADWVLRIRSLFIKRGDARTSLGTINEGASLVKEGFSLVIFPEGTRSQSSQMADFKPGALKLATKAKAVVVPVTIKDSYKMFEETGVVKKGTKLDFIVHEPIDTSKLDRKELAELGERVEEIVRSGL